MTTTMLDKVPSLFFSQLIDLLSFDDIRSLIYVSWMIRELVRDNDYKITSLPHSSIELKYFLEEFNFRSFDLSKMFVEKNNIDLIINTIIKPSIDLSYNFHLILNDFLPAIFSTSKLILPTGKELKVQREIELTILDDEQTIFNQLITSTSEIINQDTNELVLNNCVVLNGEQLIDYNQLTFINCYFDDDIFHQMNQKDRIEFNECYLSNRMIRGIAMIACTIQFSDVICSVDNINSFIRLFDDIKYKQLDQDRYYIFYAVY